MKKLKNVKKPPRLSHHVLEEINGSMKELEGLQKSKEEQARELLVIQATKESEQKQQKKLEKKLNTHQKGLEGSSGTR